MTDKLIVERVASMLDPERERAALAAIQRKRMSRFGYVFILRQFARRLNAKMNPR